MRRCSFFLSLVVFLLLSGCGVQKEDIKTSVPENLIGFGIYLVDTNDLLLSEEDVIAYDAQLYTLKVTDAAVERLQRYNGTEGMGQLYLEEFVVKTYGKELFHGQFWSVASSQTPEGITLSSDPWVAEQTKELQFSFSPFVSDEVIYQFDSGALEEYFKAEGKLVPVDMAYTVSSTEAMLRDLVYYEYPTLGVSFAYPKQYDETRCGISMSEEEGRTILNIGSRIQIAVDTDLQKRALDNVEITSKKELTIDGIDATQVGYRFGGMNRYGERTYVQYGDKMFTIGFTAGNTACGFEPAVYAKILETMRFRTPTDEAIVSTETLPPDIHPLQIVKVVNGQYALVAKPSLNVYLPDIPKDFKAEYRGVLQWNEAEKKWKKFLVISDTDPEGSVSNNPVDLWWTGAEETDRVMHLKVVDVNGAGSGEGIAKVLVPEDLSMNDWTVVECAYYSEDGYRPENFMLDLATCQSVDVRAVEE